LQQQPDEDCAFLEDLISQTLHEVTAQKETGSFTQTPDKVAAKQETSASAHTPPDKYENEVKFALWMFLVLFLVVELNYCFLL
jgi:hypothetical protein